MPQVLQVLSTQPVLLMGRTLLSVLVHMTAPPPEPPVLELPAVEVVPPLLLDPPPLPPLLLEVLPPLPLEVLPPIELELVPPLLLLVWPPLLLLVWPPLLLLVCPPLLLLVCPPLLEGGEALDAEQPTSAAIAAEMLMKPMDPEAKWKVVLMRVLGVDWRTLSANEAERGTLAGEALLSSAGAEKFARRTPIHDSFRAATFHSLPIRRGSAGRGRKCGTASRFGTCRRAERLLPRFLQRTDGARTWTVPRVTRRAGRAQVPSAASSTDSLFHRPGA